MSAKMITRLGILLSLSLSLSYLESLIPLNVSVPGVKMGLANIVTMYVLYYYGIKDASAVLILRVLISGFLFSGLSSVIFGLCGGVLSILVMYLLKKVKSLSVIGVSIAGAVSHNVGQILIALIIMDNVGVLYYLPYLSITGLISGLLVGYISALLMKKINFDSQDVH